MATPHMELVHIGDRLLSAIDLLDPTTYCREVAVVLPRLATLARMYFNDLNDAEQATVINGLLAALHRCLMSGHRAADRVYVLTRELGHHHGHRHHRRWSRSAHVATTPVSRSAPVVSQPAPPPLIAAPGGPAVEPVYTPPARQVAGPRGRGGR